MSPTRPEQHGPDPFHYPVYHPHLPQHPHPNQHQPYQPYHYGPPGTASGSAASSQPWIGPLPQYHPHYPPPHPTYSYHTHSASSSIDYGHYPHPSAPLVHPGPYRIHPPHPGPIPDGSGTYRESHPLPSPMNGLAELQGYHSAPSTSRPPTRNSIGSLSRRTSTSTIPSVHSAGSEYVPSTARSAGPRSKSAPRRQAKAPVGRTTGRKRGASRLIAAPDPPPKPPARRLSRKASTRPGSPTPSTLTPVPSTGAAPDLPVPANPGEDDEDGEDTYPPSNITCLNVKYPILEAPPGTTYSVNNFVILIPAHYAPPGTDIEASEYEQYSCRLCRKTYSGKNARSVARRHLQDKHAVRLELQERRSRWDRNAERPIGEMEKNERNRANKAEWARKHRLAERERIEAALQKDQQKSLSRPKRGKKKASTSTSSSSAAPTDHPVLGPSATLHSLTSLGTFSSDIDLDEDIDADIDPNATLVDPGCDTSLAILQSSWIAKPTGAESPAEFIRQVGSHRAESQSPLSSSPDLAVLGAHQQWAIPEGWGEMTENQMMSWMALAPGDLEEEAGGEAGMGMMEERSADSTVDSVPLLPAELAETLLVLHSSPSHHTSTPRPALISRPTPLRRFTLGSSSSAIIPTSSALSLATEQYPWPEGGLETPISLRPPIPKSKWKQDENDPSVLVGEKRRGGTSGRLGMGERSLSFSAAVPVLAQKLGGGDDPFFVTPIGSALGPKGKGGDESVDQRRGSRGGMDGSPVPFKKRLPLNAILPNPSSITYNSNSHIHEASSESRHHPSSSLSSTLVAANTHFHPPTISPLKRHTFGTGPGTGTGFATPITRRAVGGGGAGTRFGQALYGRTPGTIRGIGGGREGRVERDREMGRWALSSPAGNGMAAELGLVGHYGYVEGLETPMQGVVGSETPARE